MILALGLTVGDGIAIVGIVVGIVGCAIGYVVSQTRDGAVLATELKNLTACVREGFDELKEMFGDHEERIRHLERAKGPRDPQAGGAD